jgi:hypothetical protein
MHFPIRTYKQREKKTVWGSQAVNRNKELVNRTC